MKIMLMVPPYIDKHSIPGMRFDTTVEDLGLEYIKAYLQANGYTDTYILHCPIQNIDIPELFEIFSSEKPDCLGISISFESTDYIGGIQAAEIFKQVFPEKKVFVGGHAATFSYERLMCECISIDYVVLSEGEMAVYDLVSAIDHHESVDNIPGIVYRSPMHGIIKSQKRKLLSNLDLLPFPCRDIYAIKVPEYALIETSRGCWGKCAFCSVPTFFSYCEGPVWRTRSPKSIVDEIEYIVNRWGITKFDFVDDNFVGAGNVGKMKLQGFSNLIHSRGLKICFNIACRVDSISIENLNILKEIGLSKVYIGLESGCNTTLKRFGKNTTVLENERAVSIVKSLGLQAKLNFIMFDPWMTSGELKETLHFIERIECYDYVHWTSLLNSYKPMIGTKMYELLSVNYALLNECEYFSYPIFDKRVESIREVCKLISSAMSHIYNLIKKDYNLSERFIVLDRCLSKYLVKLLLHMLDSDDCEIINNYSLIIHCMFDELLKQYLGENVYERIGEIIRTSEK